MTSAELFRQNGVIAAGLAGYEERPQQIRMVEAVEEAIADSKNLIVEAGTGVGKSLGYLVPFIMWAVRENKRVVISTYTKALQNQLFIKDLPFLRRILDADLRYAMCMGSENYVCLRKARRDLMQDLFRAKKHAEQAERINDWLSRTDTGLVTDMDFVPDKIVWAGFSREADICRGRRCPYGAKCFYRKARKTQSEAHILITNHSLLFASMLSDAQAVPDFQAVVLDEAHTVEDVATGYFGVEFSTAGLKHLLDGVFSFLSGAWRKHAPQSGVYDEARRAGEKVNALKTASEGFIDEISAVFGEENGTLKFDDIQLFENDITVFLGEAAGDLRRLAEVLKERGNGNRAPDITGGDARWALGAADTEDTLFAEEYETARAFAERCDRMSAAVDFIFSRRKEEYVSWVEIKTGKTGTNYSFHASPVDISGEMREYLFERVCPVVMTSATLSLSGREPDFGFFRKRLGASDAIELRLDSPFDYAKNVLIYAPGHVPDPNDNFEDYAEEVRKHIVDLYGIMGGRIFALFTSYAMLNTVSDAIAAGHPDVKMLRQGDLPRYVLLDVFKKDRDSVLMGTTTFWQGVDVPGEALECVIISKLPFSVPTDPVNAARIESMKEKGFNPFYEYQLPQAIIMFKQGFGRLIRSRSDRGVVVILDPRIRTRRYGRKFIEALPPCRQTDDIRDVREFFGPG
ncbi:MAG: helicase C-terminal domain-containing protein [Candidatus Omnitrophota bacterium]